SIGARIGTKIKATVASENGVTVVRLGPGDLQNVIRDRAVLADAIAGKGTVLFDLRGSKLAQYILPETLPISAESFAPAHMIRVHSGYVTETGSSSGDYESYWETREGPV